MSLVISVLSMAFFYRSTWCTRRFIIGSKGSRLSLAIDFFSLSDGKFHGYEYYFQCIGVYSICPNPKLSEAHIFFFVLNMIISFALNFFCHVTACSSQFHPLSFEANTIFCCNNWRRLFRLNFCYPSIYREVLSRDAFSEGEKVDFQEFYKYAAATTSMSKSLDIRAD